MVMKGKSGGKGINYEVGINIYTLVYIVFPDGSVIKNLPAMQEMRVKLLGWEDPLKKETVTHSSILAWRISWIEEPGSLQSIGVTKNQT